MTHHFVSGGRVVKTGEEWKTRWWYLMMIMMMEQLFLSPDLSRCLWVQFSNIWVLYFFYMILNNPSMISFMYIQFFKYTFTCSLKHQILLHFILHSAKDGFSQNRGCNKKLLFHCWRRSTLGRAITVLAACGYHRRWNPSLGF